LQGTTWLALHPWQQWGNAFQPLQISVEETEDAWLQGLLSVVSVHTSGSFKASSLMVLSQQLKKSSTMHTLRLIERRRLCVFRRRLSLKFSLNLFFILFLSLCV
jgi:hypothetical protein